MIDMGLIETIRNIFNKKEKTTDDITITKTDDLKENIEKLAKEQELIDKLYAKNGLTDEVLDKQVKLNQQRNKLDISDRKNRIYDRFVQ